jgi:hypothetical protein
VRFRMLFKKCTMACSISFYRNHSTFEVSNPNILFCSFLPMLSWIISLIFMVRLFLGFYNYYLFEFFILSVCPFLRRRKIGSKIRSHQIHTRLLKPAWISLSLYSHWQHTNHRWYAIQKHVYCHSFWSPLMAVMGRINICWGLFSFTWKTFICPNTVFLPLFNTPLW